MSISLSFVTIHKVNASEWTVVEKSFPDSNGKWNMTTASMEKRFTEEKTAEMAAREFAALRKLMFVPENKHVVTFTPFFVGYMVVELAPEKDGILGGHHSPKIEEVISHAITFAKENNMQFIPSVSKPNFG